MSTVILSIFGVLMIFSAEMFTYAMLGLNAMIFSIFRQLAFLVMGYILGFICYKKFDVRKISFVTSVGFVMFMIVFMLLPRFVFHSFNAPRGVYRWVPVFNFMTLQPSEFFKLFFILFFAQYVFKYKRYFKLKQYYLFLPLTFLVVSFLIIMGIQKDLGTALILFFTAIALYLAVPFKHMKKIQVCLLIIFGVFMIFYFFLFENFIHLIADAGLMAQYRTDRILAAFNPLGDPRGTTMQLANGMVAISNGGLFGRGLGNSMMKYGFIPEVNNDFIFTIIAEELGFIAVCIMMVLYSLYIFECLKYAQKTKDIRSRIILVGISAHFVSHIFVNIGGVSGLIPMTGAPLLFISAGGSALLVAMMMSGIALAIIKKERILAEKERNNVQSMNKRSNHASNIR